MAAARLPRPHVLGAIVWRDHLSKRSYRAGFALDAFHGIVTLSIYFFISRFFSEPNSAALNGAPYFAFAATGIITAGMVLSLTAERSLREEQLSGTLETLAAQPLSATEMCLGLVGFPCAFAVARALLYLVIASAAMNLDLLRVSWLGLMVALVSAAAAFAVLAVVAAATVLLVRRGDVLTAMVVTILTVLSGSVFPITTLPSWLQPIARILPTHVAFDAVRNAVFRGEGYGLDVLALVVMAAVGIPLAAAIFGLALGTAQRSGSLAEY